MKFMIVKKFNNKNTYKKLIEYYFNKCDVIMFVFRTDGLSIYDKQQMKNKSELIEKQLKSSLIKNINRPTWVFHESANSEYSCLSDEDFIQQFNIYFYKCTEEVKKYLLSNQNIYTWLNPNYPEDMSFFKDGYCLLNTLTHEEICDIEVETKEEYEYLKNIGIEFYDNKFTKADKKHMYYEEI